MMKCHEYILDVMCIFTITITSDCETAYIKDLKIKADFRIKYNKYCGNLIPSKTQEQNNVLFAGNRDQRRYLTMY